jgi:hypothetical protein
VAIGSRGCKRKCKVWHSISGRMSPKNLILTVDADWDNGTPPPAYQDLMRGIGHALNLADDQFGSTVDKCVKRAAVEDDDDDEDGRVIMETAWAELTCGNDQGRTRVTIAKPR